ncbi:MAG: zinc ribbon domain-containing protein [Alkalispirochaetaceae bacterium]
MQGRRFFCENCGEQVKPTAKVCPGCGAFFTNVRCPRCSYTGKAHEFSQGCPVCGYLGRISSPRREEGGSFPMAEHSSRTSRRGGVGRRRERPWWLFPMILIFLVLSFILLSIIYMRL